MWWAFSLGFSILRSQRTVPPGATILVDLSPTLGSMVSIDWDGVRVRLAGHIGVIERDRSAGSRARATAAGERGSHALAADVESMSSRMSGPSKTNSQSDRGCGEA